MELYRKYHSLNDALYHLAEQVNDSIDYALNDCPRFTHPEQLFTWFRANSQYQHDPGGTELFQHWPTFFSDYTSQNGTHYAPGAGDCDDFVINVLAAMYAQGWDDLFIVLAGNNGSEPSHIWCGLWWNGEPYHMDLTQAWPNSYREYEYIQILEW